MVNDARKNDKSGDGLSTTAMHISRDPSDILNLTSLPNFILEWIGKNSNDVTIIWNQEGKLIYISKSVERLLGYTPAQLKSKPWNRFIAKDDRGKINNYLKSNGTKQTFTIQIKNSSDHYVWCECIIDKLREKEQDEYFYVSIIRDASDKKEVEDIMIRSEKMSIAGQLAAGVAHEIRNPLTSLKGFLQLLQAGVNRKEIYYKIMIDEIEKMEMITSELLFISKPLTDFKQQESVGQMIEDVVELLKPQAKLKGIIIIYELERDHFVYCDRSQIKQVLINIIKNAMEAMETEGKIMIKVRTAAKDLLIDVIDEGPGIDEAIIHKLGEPFFTTKQSGTGLGLMITKQILDRHGAKLNIMQNEGKGSTFQIRFQDTQ